ncbi:hypothetical protein DPMN_114656 [Dreissena polymorpha]|uniref:Uncharacterized protein n=1 Tax=Dreissena polymorpha TaxID=45954 RepID=A0A9D4QS85_DREPO|nr:hypothetical protein DPMN_114656 [Dreissena polymorpha]
MTAVIIVINKQVRTTTVRYEAVGIATDWYGQHQRVTEIMESAVSGEESTSSIQNQEPVATDIQKLLRLITDQLRTVPKRIRSSFCDRGITAQLRSDTCGHNVVKEDVDTALRVTWVNFEHVQHLRGEDNLRKSMYDVRITLSLDCHNVLATSIGF